MEKIGMASSISPDNRIQKTFNSQANPNQMREKHISRLLTDEYAERILVATHDRPRSVQDVSNKDDIPIAACYRKVHELEELGLLHCAEIVTTPKGKTMKLYRSQLKTATLIYEKGVFKVRLEFNYDRDINGKWIELNPVVTV
jgi:hypothetical protein